MKIQKACRMKKISIFIFILYLIMNASINPAFSKNNGKQVYYDLPFSQDYSIKYYYNVQGVSLKKVEADLDGKIKVLSSSGLLHPYAGAFLYPGTLEPDLTYRPFSRKNISDLKVYNQQFVYLDDEAVLSNAWAGKLFSKHKMPAAVIFEGGEDFSFLVSDGRDLKYIKSSEILWEGKLSGKVTDIKFSHEENTFRILTPSSLSTFSPETGKIKTVFEGSGFTSFDVIANNRIVIGTDNGYLEINGATSEMTGEPKINLPCPEITAVKEINGNIWFGSVSGAFMLKENGKFNYYYGQRWLPGNKVSDISEGPDGSVLVLTDKGLGQIFFKEMTLRDKAMIFEEQVRLRHIRYGFNATLSGLKNGNLSGGYLSDSDNDGLWTSMYLGSQIFRYAVTGSDEALQNCISSLDAMERLYTINPVEGFPSRSFERSGFIDVLSNPERWQHSSDPEWDWKATTSSDEAIGHIFAFGAMAELIDVDSLRTKAINLIDKLMQHIVDNDLYLVDYDGRPTMWGRWNPEYVNALPVIVGDRKLNSSNIIAMLQTAWYFTGKEIYREKAFELINEHGYLENLMRPMAEIGRAPEDADDWSRMLSGSWNHSDDEMYYLGYWGLYRYAFNDTLRKMYRESIIDHWKHERPEKDGLWNIFTAMVSNDFDLDEAIWYLQEHPLDLIQWDIKNSHRKDIEFIEDNFRNQTIADVLPPDERPVQRHNANMFRLDMTGSNGTSELSAGDIWLLPYWLGRYLGVIINNNQK